jgi:uncharacterized membrane protein
MLDPSFLAAFFSLDYAAVAVLFLAWFGSGWVIEHPPSWRPSVNLLVSGYQRQWMREMARRDNRIFDSQVIATLRQGASFFASATILAIGGGLALVGNTEPLARLSSDLRFASDPGVLWEAKLLLLVIMLVNAFLKFVWSLRLFGYCAVLMAAVPNDVNDPTAQMRADQAGEVCVNAARSFNRGLRTTYFTLAATAWLLGPALLIFASAITVIVVWGREFSSRSRAVMLQGAHLPTQT